MLDRSIHRARPASEDYVQLKEQSPWRTDSSATDSNPGTGTFVQWGSLMQLPTRLKNRKNARLVIPAVALICAVVLSGCEGSTIPATNVGTTTATLNAQASCSGGVPTPCSWYWRWGTNGNYQYSSAIGGPVTTTWSGTLSYTVTGLTPGTTYGYELCGEGDNISSFVCLVSANGTPSQFTTESSGSSSTPSTTTTTSTRPAPAIPVRRPRPAPSRQRPRPAPVRQRPLSPRRHQLPSFRPTTQAPSTGTPPASGVANPTKCWRTTPESATLSFS